MKRIVLHRFLLVLTAVGLLLAWFDIVRAGAAPIARDSNPDLAGVVLSLSDLPATFKVMPADTLDNSESMLSGFARNLSEATFQNLTGYQTSDIQDLQLVISGIVSPLTPLEQAAIDQQLSGSGTAEALGKAFSGRDIAMLPEAGDIGNTRLAFSMGVASMRMEYIVARRGPVLIEIAVLYPQQNQPSISTTELARLLDQRTIAIVGTGATFGFRPTSPLVPELTTHIPTPLDISTRPAVIGANMLLAALLMLPFAVAAELFTRILAEKEGALRRRFKPVDWLGRMQERLEKSLGSHLRHPALQDMAKLVGVMLFYGLIFSLLDKSWNPFSTQGLVLFVSMTIAYGLVGVADDILQWRKLRKWGIEADLSIRPTNVLLAAASTLSSRLFSLAPGLMFGTPDALHYNEESLDSDRHYHLHKISAKTFIFIGLGVWVPTIITGVLQRLRLPESTTNIVGGLEAFLLVIFAVALENMFVQMLGFPGGFGQALKKKHRWLWLGGLVFVAFIFLHTLLNPRGDLAEALQESNVQLFLVVVAIFIVIAFGLWVVLRLQSRSKAATMIQPQIQSAGQITPMYVQDGGHGANALPIVVTFPPVLAGRGETRQCPICCNTIKVEAKLCRFCHATFSVTLKGYCLSDHDIVEVDEAGKCARCGKVAADIHVESQLLQAPANMPRQTAAENVGTPVAAQVKEAVPEIRSDTKPCPACGQTIKAEAKICRYCRTVLVAVSK